MNSQDKLLKEIEKVEKEVSKMEATQSKVCLVSTYTILNPKP